MGYQRTVKWDAFLNANPTTIANEVNTISTIGFISEVVRLNYLKLQYKFRHLKQASEKFYTSDSYIGDINNNLLPFAKPISLQVEKLLNLLIILY